MKSLTLFISASLLLVLSGCDHGPKSGTGFTLPDGDATKGQALFVQMQCNDCHTVTANTESGNPKIVQPENAEISVKIGGKVRLIKTYGQLVTSVINPSHRLAKGYPPAMIQSDGESKMRNYNSVMTVEQLIHLVAFLQVQYELEPYTPSRYSSYYY